MEQRYSRPAVISIAGLDPSGGAGLLADIKTFEQYRCLGFGVVSALTVQTEAACISVQWMEVQQVIAQLSPLVERYDIAAVKIGIIQGLEQLGAIVGWLRDCLPSVPIVWDPVIKASSGFTFITDIETDLLKRALRQITVVTPNVQEALQLSGVAHAQEAGRLLSRYCSVLLKGGHALDNIGTDYLFERSCNEPVVLAPQEGRNMSKHGSGCILSAAIAAGMANGQELDAACHSAKNYIHRILNSNDQLLAYHVQ